MLTGPLTFIGPLTVGRASDSQRALFFSRDQMVRGVPTALTCFFCRFPHRFHDLCEGFGCLRLSLGTRGPSTLGPRKPQGGTHPLRPPPSPWLRPWPGRRWSKALIETILINTLKIIFQWSCVRLRSRQRKHAIWAYWPQISQNKRQRNQTFMNVTIGFELFEMEYVRSEFCCP